MLKRMAFRPHSPRIFKLYWLYSGDKAIWINLAPACGKVQLYKSWAGFAKAQGTLWKSLELHSDLLWVSQSS
eukprot:s3100_g4.t1